MQQSHLRTVLLGLVSTLLLVSSPAAWADSRLDDSQFRRPACRQRRRQHQRDRDHRRRLFGSQARDSSRNADPLRRGHAPVQPSRQAAGSVDDGEGREYEDSVSYEENLMKIRIGSPNFTVQGGGDTAFAIRLNAPSSGKGNHAWEKRELRGPSLERHGHRVAGPDRCIEGDRSPARDLNDFELGYDAWTGYFSARGKEFTKRALDPRTVEFTTGLLRPREGITVEISMPADAVDQPGWWKEITWWLADNFPYAVFPAGGCAFVFFSGSFAAATCREPARSSSTTNRRTGLTPAEVGTLVDEQVDLRDISATIIDLAVRGYLKIEEVDANSWFSSGSDYRFIKLKEPQGTQELRAEPVQQDLRRQEAASP